MLDGQILCGMLDTSSREDPASRKLVNRGAGVLSGIPNPFVGCVGEVSQLVLIASSRSLPAKVQQSRPMSDPRGAARTRRRLRDE